MEDEKDKAESIDEEDDQEDKNDLDEEVEDEVKGHAPRGRGQRHV
jgi:hypothetical protein